MKSMKTKVLETIEQKVLNYQKDNNEEHKFDFIVNFYTEDSGNAYIMTSYIVKLSIFFEFYYDYFKIIIYPEGVKPDIASLNANMHLNQFIIEYHNAKETRYMLEFLESKLSEVNFDEEV